LPRREGGPRPGTGQILFTLPLFARDQRTGTVPDIDGIDTSPRRPAPIRAGAFVVAGLVGVIGAVVAEFMIGQAGLGRRFGLDNAQTDTTAAWGGASAIFVLSMTSFAIASGAERLVHRRFV
jgi:hypothetical protein